MPHVKEPFTLSCINTLTNGPLCQETCLLSSSVFATRKGSNQHIQKWVQCKLYYCKFGNFREGTRMLSFCKNKTHVNWRNHSVVHWCRYIMSKSRISSVANMYFNAIHENIILAKISKSTVHTNVCHWSNLQYYMFLIWPSTKVAQKISFSITKVPLGLKFRWAIQAHHGHLVCLSGLTVKPL